MTQQFRIGGIAIRLEWAACQDSAMPTHPLYVPFHDAGAPDLTLSIAPASHQPMLDTLEVDSFPHWRIWRTQEGFVYEVFDARPPHPRVHWALLNETLTEGCIWMERGDAAIGRLMEPLGQLLFLQRWAQRQMHMVHALAVDDRGVGRVFVGHSGAGKSTLARWYQAEGVTVLSDERVVLQLDGDRLLAHGTPWPGMAWSGAPGPVMVETLYFLEHAPQHHLEPLTACAAIALLYPQLFLPTRDRAEDVDAALAWCEETIARVPAARLAFAKAPDVLDYVRHTASQIAPTVVR